MVLSAKGLLAGKLSKQTETGQTEKTPGVILLYLILHFQRIWAGSASCNQPASPPWKRRQVMVSCCMQDAEKAFFPSKYLCKCLQCFAFCPFVSWDEDRIAFPIRSKVLANTLLEHSYCFYYLCMYSVHTAPYTT